MSAKTAYVSAWVLLALTFLMSVLAYPALPVTVATHWNMTGQVNGVMSALWGDFFLPFVMLALLVILSAIPSIDTNDAGRANIAAFRRQYNTFLAVLMFVLAIIQGSVLAFNLGVHLNIVSVVMPAIGILFFYIGMILPETKRNYFIGIRTPWTLSSDIVWQKTHELGGKLFKILGIVLCLSAFVPGLAFPVTIVMLAIVVLGLFVYSYVEYREFQRTK